MLRNFLVVGFLGLASAGSAFAQACPCASSPAVLINDSAALATKLGNKMACAVVGNEQWQEWHNGSSSGPVVDYKKGPADPVDPSTSVGTFVINADATITYAYGSSTYRYAVCSEGTGSTTHFCGAALGGRDILNARVGGSGLQACSGVN